MHAQCSNCLKSSGEGCQVAPCMHSARIVSKEVGRGARLPHACTVLDLSQKKWGGVSGCAMHAQCSTCLKRSGEGCQVAPCMHSARLVSKDVGRGVRLRLCQFFAVMHAWNWGSDDGDMHEDMRANGEVGVDPQYPIILSTD